MITPRRRTARHLAFIPLIALLAVACGPDSNGPSGLTSPGLLANRSGGGGSSSGPSLRTESSFALLGGPAVTCKGSTIPVTVTGDVGAGSPGGAVTLTQCTVTGAVHRGDAAAAQAYNDFLLDYIDFAGVACPTGAAHNLTGTLASVTLTPGVYCLDPTAKTGVLTLDAQGDANAVWILKTEIGALTGTNFSVNLINGAQACNVFWWVQAGSTMTWNTAQTTTNFVGTILAGAAITFTGVTSAPGSFVGRAWAKAAVTMTDMNVTNSCGAGGPGPGPRECKQDRVTGGGFIELPSSDKKHSSPKGTFSVSGGIRNGAFKGQLEYDDHRRDGIKVKGTGVTQYLVVDAVTRHIEGTAKVDGVRGFTYKVDVADNGEGRRDPDDKFAIWIYNAAGALVYSASGSVRGGNIQLHDGRGGRCDKDDDDDNDGNGDNGHGDDGHGEGGHGS